MCAPGSTGPITSCTFNMFWDGSDPANGFAGENLNALFIGGGIANDPPVASDDSPSTSEDVGVTVDVAANDTDPDANLDPTTTNTACVGCSTPSDGSLTNNGDGTFDYTPNQDFNGPDAFVYEICDTLGLCDTATVSITVNAVDDPPVANDDSPSTYEGVLVTVDVAANDTDPDGNLDPTTANTACVGCSTPADGSLTNNGDGTFLYTPDVGFNGPDSFVYEICDLTALCDTATVDITVTVTNDPPVASDDSPSTSEDVGVTVDVAFNDTDPDGNLDPTTTNTTCVGCSTPTDGSLTNNGDGTFDYTPNQDFNGPDSFVYEICDTLGLCDTATVSITVNAVDDPPVASNDSPFTSEDVAVLVDVAANDTDPDGDLDPTTANTACVGCSTPADGLLTNNGDGTFLYTPDVGFTGPDSFVYEICDLTALCDTATVDVTVDTAGGGLYYMSFDINTTVPGIGVEVRDEDIVVYDPATGNWAMHFDASDVGITSSDLVAFHIRADGTILMSYSSTITVPGLTAGPAGETVDDTDLFVFTPTTTGDTTAGSFSFYFDGSDVGLDTSGEDIIGVHEFADSSIAITPEATSTWPDPAKTKTSTYSPAPTVPTPPAAGSSTSTAPTSDSPQTSTASRSTTTPTSSSPPRSPSLLQAPPPTTKTSPASPEPTNPHNQRHQHPRTRPLHPRHRPRRRHRRHPPRLTLRASFTHL